MPTFMIFKNSLIVETIKGADPRKLSEAVQKLAAEAGASASGGFKTSGVSGSSGDGWVGAPLPKGYQNVTEQVEIRGVDLLNSDGDLGDAATLFADSKPSGDAVAKGKRKETEDAKADWVESDTDEQIMLYLPFRSTLKVHSLQITSLPPREGEVMRPKTINLYTNHSHVLGFDEAEDMAPTQSVELKEGDWDEQTGTARVELRLVKFQNVTSLVVFVVDGEGEGERVRLDRLRVVGETGEKRAMGKLEKVTDSD